MPDKLSGRVAEILNERELVINLGRERGVKPGMKFAVLAAEPKEIRDPETGDLLDVLDREKVRVAAMEVRDKIAICKTYGINTEIANIFSLIYKSSNLFKLIDLTPKEAETLRVKDDPQLQTLAPEESYVKIGDRVVQIAD
ncbi:hypothetical protein BH23PLA1_BH23PLA1_08640 [soil metagenome]